MPSRERNMQALWRIARSGFRAPATHTDLPKEQEAGLDRGPQIQAYLR